MTSKYYWKINKGIVYAFILAIAIAIVGVLFLFDYLGYEIGKDETNVNSFSTNYYSGMNKGINICEDNLKPMIQQYIPKENCLMIIYDNLLMEQVCNKSEKYNYIKDKAGKQ